MCAVSVKTKQRGKSPFLAPNFVTSYLNFGFCAVKMSFSVKSVNTTLNELRQLKHVFKSKGGLAESASSSNTRLIDSVSSSNSQLPRRDPAKLWERAIEIIRRRVRIILAFPIQTHLTQDDKMDFENAVGTENHFESGSSRLV